MTDEVEPQVKGICLRNGLTLISMDTVGMWHEVGFLARAFTVFSEHGVSVDLVSTSETNVTVSIDTADGMLAPDTERALLADLAPTVPGPHDHGLLGGEPGRSQDPHDRAASSRRRWRSSKKRRST